MNALHRLLDLVKRDLGADDARAEMGGRDPDDPRLVWCLLPGGWRLVALFAEVPDDRERVTERLRAMAESFSGVAPSVDEFSAISRELASRRLDDELEELADRAGAVRALVIDAQSPVIWGCSGARRPGEDVESALATADALDAAESAGVDFAELLEQDAQSARARLAEHGVDGRVASFLAREAERVRRESRRSGLAWRNHLLTIRAIATVRKHMTEDQNGAAHLREIVRHEQWGYLARAFATIYCLVLVFEGRYSELHAEGAAVHALPVIERLVLALPPIDPPPKPGKVVRLRTPR